MEGKGKQREGERDGRLRDLDCLYCSLYLSIWERRLLLLNRRAVSIASETWFKRGEAFTTAGLIYKAEERLDVAQAAQALLSTPSNITVDTARNTIRREQAQRICHCALPSSLIPCNIGRSRYENVLTYVSAKVKG